MTVAALVILGRKRATWLAIPALWPATQVHYSVFALPAASRLMAGIMALPIPVAPVIAVLVEAGRTLYKSPRAATSHDSELQTDVRAGSEESAMTEPDTRGAGVGSTPPPEVAIVLPVYNEGTAVEPVLQALSRAVTTPHELVVVYDFDGDTTVPVIQRLQAEIPSLRGLRNDLGRGVLNAMKAGIAGTTAPYVLISMADGSDDPLAVDRMVELAKAGADVVSASRYMKGGRQIGGPPLKRLMSRAAGLTLHWFARVPTHDPTNNFKLYSRRFLESTSIESTAGFELALELTVKATLDHRRIAEIPTTWRDRTAGQSNFKLRQWLPHYLRWYRMAFLRR